MAPFLVCVTSGTTYQRSRFPPGPRPPPPPNPPRPPPPPPARGSCGRASLTVNVRPPMSEPLSAVIAACRLGIRGHLHEAKSAGLSRELVRDDPRRSHRAMRRQTNRSTAARSPNRATHRRKSSNPCGVPPLNDDIVLNTRNGEGAGRRRETCGDLGLTSDEIPGQGNIDVAGLTS